MSEKLFREAVCEALTILAAVDEFQRGLLLPADLQRFEQSDLLAVGRGAAEQIGVDLLDPVCVGAGSFHGGRRGSKRSDGNGDGNPGETFHRFLLIRGGTMTSGWMYYRSGDSSPTRTNGAQ
jgi:hypothetical protein